MIHDEACGIILDVCMCHCILIMAAVSWKLRRTFKGDHLIFSSLSLLSLPRWQMLRLRTPVKGAIAYTEAPRRSDNKRKKQEMTDQVKSTKGRK